ncbi:MAG: FG-GAP repeat domain-containing protein [Myxococcota bacterium]
MPTFAAHVVDANAAGPAFAEVLDLNDDGKLDILVSMFGNLGMSIPDGEVRAYLQGATLDDWTVEALLPPSAGYRWPNGLTLFDIDGDGDQDVFVPFGFLVCDAIPLAGPCGALIWMENTPSGWTIHEIVPDGNELFFHHVDFADIDGDGIRDAITVGERKPTFGESVAKLMWFKGTASGDRFEKTPIEVGDGAGSIPTAVDLDGDGDVDVVSAEYFRPDAASFVWMENPGDATQPFTRHVIADDVGPSIQLTLVPDLYGDGVLRAIGSNHTNTQDDPSAPESAVYVLDVPEPSAVKTVAAWPKVKISQGIVSDKSPMFAPMAAPGIFGHGDIDGDGDIDVLLSGDGDPHVYWLRQMGPGQFETHVLDPQLKQAGGMKVVDLNGDGKNELIVTGYEANVVRVYERQ